MSFGEIEIAFCECTLRFVKSEREQPTSGTFHAYQVIHELSYHKSIQAKTIYGALNTKLTGLLSYD